MGEPAIIRVQFDGFGLENKPVTFNAQDWWVHETNGVQLLTVQDRESSEITHDIPLASVLYWSTEPCVDNGAEEPIDRYCDSCKVYFSANGTVLAYTHKEHDVRRVCCGSSVQGEHHPSCTVRDPASEQRDAEKRSFHLYDQLGQIVDIHNDDNGIHVTATVENVPGHLKRFVKPDPNQPGVG